MITSFPLLNLSFDTDCSTELLLISLVIDCLAPSGPNKIVLKISPTYPTKVCKEPAMLFKSNLGGFKVFTASPRISNQSFIFFRRILKIPAPFPVLSESPFQNNLKNESEILDLLLSGSPPKADINIFASPDLLLPPPFSLSPKKNRSILAPILITLSQCLAKNIVPKRKRIVLNCPPTEDANFLGSNLSETLFPRSDKCFMSLLVLLVKDHSRR